MIEMLQYGFMQRAFITGILLAVIAPLIGITIVLKRMSMIGDPKLLILDEPTTGVDARSTKILYDMLYEINTKYNTTIFMITHGRLQECKGCDRILRMDEGRIVEE